MIRFLSGLFAFIRSKTTASRAPAQQIPDANWQQPPPDLYRSPEAAGDRPSPGLIIVDPSLDGFVGHHYEYDFSTAHAAIAAGYETAILGKRPMAEALIDDPLLTPVFELDMWAKSPDFINFSENDLIFCNQGFYRDLLVGLSQFSLQPGTVIFGHMITAKQLLGWAWFLERQALQNRLNVVLLLRYEPSVYGGRFADWSFRTFERLGVNGALRLASDSARLAGDFQALTSLPVEVFAIPHSKDPAAAQTPSRKRSSASGPLRFVCLGNPRVDKGFCDVLAAIDLINTGAEADLVEFVLQANDPGHGIDADLERFRHDMPANTRLISEAMSPHAYFETLFEADVVILPYWVSTYQSRTSGVFVEAVCAGKIIICSEDTWMADELRANGSGIVCGERDATGLASAFAQCLHEHELLARLAVARAADYRARHNAPKLVQDIFGRRPTAPGETI